MISSAMLKCVEWSHSVRILQPAAVPVSAQHQPTPHTPPSGSRGLKPGRSVGSARNTNTNGRGACTTTHPAQTRAQTPIVRSAESRNRRCARDGVAVLATV